MRLECFEPLDPQDRALARHLILCRGPLPEHHLRAALSRGSGFVPWRFADKDDGYLDEIHPLCDKYDADLAVLMVDDPTGCGLATRVFANADEAFAVVHLANSKAPNH